MKSHPIGNVLEMANFPYTLIPHFVFAIFTHFSSTKATHLKIVRKGVPQQYLTADMPHAESSAVVKMRKNLNTLAVLKLGLDLIKPQEMCFVKAVFCLLIKFVLKRSSL